MPGLETLPSERERVCLGKTFRSGLKISAATKDHKERREQPFFELQVIFRGKKSG
jgi:hypothetical protein